ncbi:MAG TPA: nuclear transport factor 2 family protein [Acidimicrobiia bacterium]|nr:nuclear transport factor 2 family protein [Acidimicrobiia bacterium]
MSGTLHDWIEGYRAAWEARDADAVIELFRPEATYRSNIFEEPHRGREGIRAYWTSVTEAQSDVTVRMGKPYVDGSRVTVEFWTNMKVSGDDVTLPGCLLLHFDDDGLCTSLHEYWHFEPGTHQPPPEWGT